MSQKGGVPIVLGMADNGSEDSTTMVHEKMDAKSRKMCMKKCKKHGHKCTNKCLKKMKSKKNKRGGGLFDFWKKNEEQIPIPNEPMQMPIQPNEANASFFGKFSNSIKNVFKPNECDQEYADAINKFNDENKYKNEYDQEFIALKNRKLIELSNAKMRCKNAQQNAGGKKPIRKTKKNKSRKSRRKY